MVFKRAQAVGAVPDSPLALFADLPRMGGAVPNLWGHQTGVLSAYVDDKYVKARDLAIELPTGTGKTVPGLLIADWRRRTLAEQVVYACPTVMLAHQAARAARREGVPAVTLVGDHRKWPLVDSTRYDAGEAIAVTTYSSLFNASPKLGRPAVLLFDDAHAAEQFVAQAWSIDIHRFEDTDLYKGVVEAIKPALDPMFRERLAEDDPDPLARMDTRLVIPLRWDLVRELDEALSHARDSLAWSYSMIRSGLASCLVYVAWNRILVRPFIPPTFENTPFTAARQRVYLSATLGRAGELERAFGCAPITRLELPPESGTPRNGRRFFLFPGMVQGGDTTELARAITEAAGKALVLALSKDQAETTAQELNPGAWPVLTHAQVATSLDPFSNAAHALLALARYDGMDLPDASCRLVVLDGKPDAVHLQERYLADQLRARVALEERVRTRIVQGAGRCTRKPDDYALVAVMGDELSRYLCEAGVRRALSPELQAEVGFGVDNSQTTPTEVLANVRAFLAQGDEWRDQAEPEIARRRHGATQQPPPGTDLLAGSVAHEIDAWRSAWKRAWSDAARSAEAAAHALSGSEETRHYRAFWLYLASVWLRAAADSGDSTASASAEALLRRANEASRGTTWLREVEPAVSRTEQSGVDDVPAIRTIAARLGVKAKRIRHQQEVAEITAGLAATDPGRFEPALTALGQLMGAEAYKPTGQGRSDSVWCWGERIWISFEAKSDEAPGKALPLRDVRQANTQLRQLAADRGVDLPATNASIIVAPGTKVDADAVPAAEGHVYLVTPDLLLKLATDIASAWDAMLGQAADQQPGDLQRLVRRALSEHSVMPTQVFTRLTARPLGG